MRVFLSALFLAAATLVPLAEAQTPDDSNEGSRLEWDAANSIWRFKWWGRQGRTYFIQHSDNLQTWLWLPLVEPGNHAVREWGFTSTGSKFFLRLVYTDQPSSDPENDDFDGDGVSNLAEVMQGTSPLRTADSDGDGLPNDWEIATGLDPQSGSGSNGATGDVDQDGLTNEEEAALATNPQVADTDGDGLSDSQDAVPTNAIMKVKAAPEVSYAIVDLGASSDVGSVLGINDRGEVLFSKYVNNPSPGKVVAKLWSSGNFYELPEESNRVVALLQDGSVYFVTKSVTESTIAGGSTSERRRKIWKRGSPVSDGGPGYFYISKFENDSENRVMPPSSLPGIPEVLQSKVVEAFAEAREALSDGGWTLGPVGDGNLDLWYDTQWVNDAHRVGMSALLVCMEWGQGYSPGRESTISAQVYGDDAHAFSGGVTWQGKYYETLTFSTILYVAGASANRVNNFRRYSDGSYTYTLQTDSSKQTFINGAEASGCSTLVDAAVTASAEGPYYIGDDGKGEAGLWCDNGGNPAHIKLKGMPAFAGSHGAIERRITRNLVTLGGSMIWRNGRTRSLAGLTGMTGENPVWTNLSASLISPENNLIAGTASRDGASHSVLLVPVQIEEVSFGGTKYWELESDDAATTYSAPQWKDVDGNGKPTNATQGEHDYAVAFTRNTKPKIGAKFKIANASNFGTIKIKATGPDGLIIPETTGAVSGDEVTIPLTETSAALVNTIKFYNSKDDAKAFKLDWEVKLGTADWSKIGTTMHTVYVTLGDPKNLSTDRQLTLFDTACREATGLTAESDVVNKVYSVFTHTVSGIPTVQRIDPKTFKPSGAAMTYWGTSNPAPQPLCWTTAGLLSLGDGRCGAWATFFHDALSVNGIQSTVITVNPPSLSSATTKLQADIDAHLPSGSYQAVSIFYVKNWNLSGYATDPFNPIRNSGVAGQGNPNPRADFDNHAIVEYGGKYYDPSYGAPVFNSGVNWEDSSIDGFGAYVIDQSTGNFQKWIWKPDQKGSQETTFNP